MRRRHPLTSPFWAVQRCTGAAQLPYRLLADSAADWIGACSRASSWREPGEQAWWWWHCSCSSSAGSQCGRWRERKNKTGFLVWCEAYKTLKSEWLKFLSPDWFDFGFLWKKNKCCIKQVELVDYIKKMKALTSRNGTRRFCAAKTSRKRSKKQPKNCHIRKRRFIGPWISPSLFGLTNLDLTLEGKEVHEACCSCIEFSCSNCTHEQGDACEVRDAACHRRKALVIISQPPLWCSALWMRAHFRAFASVTIPPVSISKPPPAAEKPHKLIGWRSEMITQSVSGGSAVNA